MSCGHGLLMLFSSWRTQNPSLVTLMPWQHSFPNTRSAKYKFNTAIVLNVLGNRIYRDSWSMKLQFI